MGEFKPDYRHLVEAAFGRKSSRMPIYEHFVYDEIIEQIMGEKIQGLLDGDYRDKRHYFSVYNQFYKKMGYDTVSFEFESRKSWPGSGALADHKDGVIKTRADFDRYPWDEVADLFFKENEESYRAMAEEMPAGMKAVGGIGNGVFECLEDIVGYVELCFIQMDDPKLYLDLFKKAGDVMAELWTRFMERFGDVYCVLRFGDDLGYKDSTLIPYDDIRNTIIPQYRRVVDIVHGYKKPFLFHCCGNIFEVMDDFIEKMNIDAKHSNEDQIAPMSRWIDLYGKRIGLFGGADTNVLCRKDPQTIKEYSEDIIRYALENAEGYAFGSGNAIPDYMAVENYLAMVNTAREMRNE